MHDASRNAILSSDHWEHETTRPQADWWGIYCRDSSFFRSIARASCCQPGKVSISFERPAGPSRYSASRTSLCLIRELGRTSMEPRIATGHATSSSTGLETPYRPRVRVGEALVSIPVREYTAKQLGSCGGGVTVSVLGRLRSDGANISRVRPSSCFGREDQN